MRINSNIPALNTHRMLGMTNMGLEKTLEKLSSGKRINKAADDAAGLAISQKMESQIRGLRQASRNSLDGISLLQTAEGALNEVHSMLQRMRELSVQGANGTYGEDDLRAVANEIKELTEQIHGIGEDTTFNGIYLLKGNLQAEEPADDNDIDKEKEILRLQIGANKGQFIDIDMSKINVSVGRVVKGKVVGDGDNLRIEANGETLEGVILGGEYEFGESVYVLTDIGLDIVGGKDDQEHIIKIFVENAGTDNEKLKFKVNQDHLTTENFSKAISTYDAAINKVASQRSLLGAYQNRLEHTIKNVDNTAENLTAAKSRIEDTDMALEMSEFVKLNILQQAGTAMLSQANQLPQSVLQLLQ